MQPLGQENNADQRFDISVASFASHAPEILSDKNIPVDDLKGALAAQYATCEKVRYRMLSTMWEIEEAKRWSGFLERRLTNFQNEHQAAEVGLKAWMESVQKGLVEVSQPSSRTAKNCREAKETLGILQAHFAGLEGLAIAHGVTDDDGVQGYAQVDYYVHRRDRRV